MMTRARAEEVARNMLRLPRDRAERLLADFLIDSEQTEARRLGQGFVVGVIASGMGWTLLRWLGVA